MLIYLVTLGIFFSGHTISRALAAPAVAETPTIVSAASLKQILLRYQDVSVLDVDFQQVKTLKDMKRPLRSTGHLTVRPPDSVVYKLTSPAALKVTLNAKKIVIETGRGDDKTTQVLDVSALKGSTEHRNLQAMVAWLEVNPEQLAASYKVTRTDRQTLHFVPLVASDAPFTALDMALSSQGDVTHLTMSEASGDRIEFLFSPPKIKPKK